LVPPTHTGRATSAIYVGTAAALVIGNPLTTSMSEAWGWRTAVAIMAVAACATTLLAQVMLPPMAVTATAAVAKVNPPQRARPYRNGRLVALCILTLIGVTAHFISYTYVVPIIRNVVGIDGTKQAWVLAAYGITGLLSMAVLARAMDQRLRAAVAGSLTVLCLAFWMLTALDVAGAGTITAVLGVGAIVAWGASAAVLPPMLQSAAIRTSTDQVEQASALYITAFQIGIMTGSIAGGLIYEHRGIPAVVATSAVLFAVALGGVLVRGDLFRSSPRSVPRET
jgi:predicted MFS family arabinose efflux permease